MRYSQLFLFFFKYNLMIYNNNFIDLLCSMLNYFSFKFLGLLLQWTAYYNSNNNDNIFMQLPIYLRVLVGNHHISSVVNNYITIK